MLEEAGLGPLYVYHDHALYYANASGLPYITANSLKFLREREIVHSLRFREAADIGCFFVRLKVNRLPYYRRFQRVE